MAVRLAVVTLWTFACGVASADPAPSADELRQNGEQLAKAGRYTEAIAVFKQSNKLAPRASNLCLIGLAYTRREAWSQAEVMIDRCKHEATAADPTPDWLPALEQTLADRLANIDVAPITLVVAPETAHAQLSVSSFAPDELFGARTIHLPVGSHLIVAIAPGYVRAQQTIEVTDRTPQHVVITLRPEETHPPLPVEAHSHARRLPLVLIGAGSLLLATGIIYHATVFRTAAHKLDDATNPNDPHPDEYDAWAHRYDVRREWLIALYAAGLVTAGIGVVLRLNSAERAEQRTSIAVTPLDGGGVISVVGTR